MKTPKRTLVSAALMHLLGVASAVVMTIGVVDSASAFSVGTIPGGTAKNDGLKPVYGSGTTSRAGYYGAQLYLSGGPATINIQYIGAEAGYTNEFWFGGSNLFTTPGVADKWNTKGTRSTSVASVASGLLNFKFVSDIAGPNGTAANGSNPDNTAPSSGANFFVTFTTNPLATSGTSVDLWFDDFGAGGDDDHDDMTIRLSLTKGSFSVVPIPTAAWLFGSAFLGLLGIGRRKLMGAKV